MTTTATPDESVRFNPFTAEFRRNPYPAYARLREHRPIARTMGMWVLTRHADVRAVLGDRSFSSDVIPQMVTRAAAEADHLTTGIERLGATSLVFTDDPAHARLRGLVNTVFTRTTVEALRPVVSHIAVELVDRVARAGVTDIISRVAAPLPVRVLCAWMALPSAVADHVTAWTRDIRLLLEPGLLRRGEHERIGDVIDTFTAALAEMIADRRRRPGDDLVSHLLASRTGGGDTLTDEETAHLLIMCFVAGVETTTSLIGNALLAILTRPDLADSLSCRADLVPGTIRETLRYDSPLQMTTRVAGRDSLVADHAIAAGEQVLLCLGSANRDPAVFSRPDDFDPSRRTASRAEDHLALGHGMHGCLGGALARLQAEVVVAELVGRDGQPRMTCDPADLEWQESSLILRALKQLPIELGAAS
ncbi:cytochrome P450 [Williamsia phyllosphaerae]|uniref:Cytochrome P450 n=1 Tax=Williamsia phyllosphaerae TaxID=885042 RepID=A0ABQ1V042_9NOCA|nr:cytochrome P450 [Williamsia phyllosphaerae]GGF30301.1 cytochrome P450 [Williamsia phyllosphaerae]